MTTFVTLKHECTGETKSIKTGWSWTLFLFSGFWGVPLFYRQLFDWAMIQFTLSMVFLLLSYDVVTDSDLFLVYIFLTLPSWGIAIYLGINGNELTAKQLLRQGWVFAEPNSTISQNAMQLWRLPAYSPSTDMPGAV